MQIEYNLPDLLVVFDEFDDTNEERGFYGFKYTRTDDIVISISFDKYERSLYISTKNADAITISSFRLQQCKHIRVLDVTKRQIEIISEGLGEFNVRVFLDLDGLSIISTEYESKTSSSWLSLS